MLWLPSKELEDFLNAPGWITVAAGGANFVSAISISQLRKLKHRRQRVSEQKVYEVPKGWQLFATSLMLCGAHNSYCEPMLSCVHQNRTLLWHWASSLIQKKTVAEATNQVFLFQSPFLKYKISVLLNHRIFWVGSDPQGSKDSS